MYKEFAYIYDKLTFDIDYEEYSEVIKKELKKLDIKPESILELGIGWKFVQINFLISILLMGIYVN